MLTLGSVSLSCAANTERADTQSKGEQSTGSADGAATALVTPSPAPSTTLAADGRSVSDGQRRLSISAAHDLTPGGQRVVVTGSGYSVDKGVYVAFCVLPKPGQRPPQCGGGADTTGASGDSAWISSNPPEYGRQLATPYGTGGSFRVTLSVRSAIVAGVDCRTTACAILTRNDHTRGSDRSQDLVVPVTFRDSSTGARPVPSGTGNP
jgi:hypothetical protein